MNLRSAFRWGGRRGLVLAGVLASLIAATASGREFALGGVALDLQEITTNVDVYFTSLRLNRAVNEWDVEVTVSNQTGAALAGPVVLLVDRFTGTSGPLRADGVSSNQLFFDLSGEITDGVLSATGVSAPRTIALGFTTNLPPTLVPRVFATATAAGPQALGFVRSLNHAGQPLPAVSIQETGPAGNATNATDDAFGVATLGQTAGDYVWKFDRDGYLPVWRRATLQSNTVVVIPYPWLTARSPQRFTMSPLTGGTASNQTIQVRFAAGSVSQNTSAQLTALDGQTLPAFLPQGWNPLQAFWLELGAEPTQPAVASLLPWGPISGSENAAWVEFDPTTVTWRVVQLVAGSGTNAVSASLAGSGAYALVVPDAVPSAPPAPVVGSALQPSAAPAPDPANLQASGTVTPSTSPASTVPELVTATADVVVTNRAGGLSSGALLRGEVSERYVLQDGTSRTPPIFDEFMAGYQRPGGAPAGTLRARFPMRPLLLFGPQQLNEGVVHVDLFAPGAFTGAILGTNGGLAANGSIRLLAAPGVLPSRQAIQLRSLSPTNFSDLAGTNFPVVAAFEVALSGAAPGRELTVQASGVPTNTIFVLARVIEQTGVFGLEPRERLHSDANGNLSSDEPASGDRLPGLTGAGQYVLLQVQPQQSLVEGIAKNSSGQATGGLPVSIAGQPWLTFSAPDGGFKLLAPAGAQTVTASDPATGDTGTQAIAVPTNLAPVATTVALALSGLRVASITPGDTATNVPQVTSVTITFSRPINPATLVANAVRLIGTSNQPVSATFSLDLANTAVTLLPSAPLDAAAQFTVALAANITDNLGRPLAGQSQFRFTTVALSARDPAAQLIIYEPGATNLATNVVADLPGYTPGTNQSFVVVHGTAGAADPGVPVIIVNEASGDTSTVLSKSDGSFTSYVPGQEQDFISATFISLNKSRIYVPVNRQLFDDGSVGLFPQGGVLQASGDGGAVQVTVPPNAVQTRTKFKLATLNTNQLAAQLGGVTPDSATVAGGALTMQIEGPAPVLPLQMSFPVNLANLGFPTNQPPTNVAAMLAIVQNTQDVTTFQAVDQLVFHPKAASPLSTQRRHQPKDEQLFYGVLESVLGFSGAGQAAQLALNYIIVPLLIGPKAVVIRGVVESIPPELAAAIDAGQLPAGFVPGANASLDYLKRQVGTPLGGAFIILRQLSTPDIGQPGRLRPGMVYATSSGDGSYLLVAPSLLDVYLLTATHPLYTDTHTEDIFGLAQLSLAGVVFKNFFFEKPAAIQAPPSVSIANAPQYPAPGQDCLIQVNASHVLGPPRVGVIVQSVTNLVGGLPVTLADAVLGTPTVATHGNAVQWSATLHSDKSIQAVLKVVVQAGNGFGSTTLYPVDFSGFQPPAPNQNIPPPDTNDVHGPLVVSVTPPDKGFLGPDQTITVDFNKPIDTYVTNHLAGIVLDGPGTPLQPVLHLSPDQQSLELLFPGVQPGGQYTLTLSGQSIRDLAAKPLDQRPSTLAADSFSTTFRVPPLVSGNLPQLVNGRGAVINGRYLYALDQAPQDNYFSIYDISTPTNATLIRQMHLKGAPRDLALIPHYRYKRNAQDTIQTNDLVAVVGGDLGTIIGQDQSVTVPGQYLWVFDVHDPTSPLILASPTVSYRVGSAVTKVVWAPPYLVYQEFGADIQQLGFVNLQELLFGYGSTRADQLKFPYSGQPGLDLNGDGDYVDPGERIPLPQNQPPQFYGFDFGLVLQNTTQKILDYSVIKGGEIVGVTLKAGLQVDKHGNPLPNSPLGPAYRTLAYNGFQLDIGNPTNAAVFFDPVAYPRWVSLFDSLVVLSNGVPTIPVLALVSLAPDTNNLQQLAVIDITLPLQPKLLNKIPIPDSLLGGPMESVTLRPDGLLQVAGQQNAVLLDPQHLEDAMPPGGQLHPAIAGFISNAGSLQRSVGMSDFGAFAVADGGRAVVVQTPPALSFVSFPDSAQVVDPTALHTQNDAALGNLTLTMRTAVAIPPARLHTNLDIPSDLDPPRPASHFHVMVRAPGGSGATIELGLESVNLAGRPLANLGDGYAPVRAVSVYAQTNLGQLPRGCGAPIRSLTAYRMSDDPRSQFYNRYLSRPFALISNEHVTAAELAHLRSEVDREILYSAAGLRAFIDPSQFTNAVIGAFAAQIDSQRKLIYPLAGVSAVTLNQAYITGDNPPPPGGATKMPGTYGTVCAHSGELRINALDLVLPSPHMPIEVKREIGDQDTYDGPFGAGWDFNYNQRVTELDPLSFPVGLQMPVVVRDSKADSEVAGSQDVLFHTGLGGTLIFKWVDTNMPPEYAQDPLVQEFDYKDLVSDYYLPEKGQGVFDLFVKFRDRRFERLTPEGMRYRYAPDGRLEMIIDRFPVNHHDLQYDRNGWLVRIDDRSVSAPRYVEFGHYRRQADPDFTAGLDEPTDNAFLEGKICRLLDYAGRDVVYQYNGDGFLTNRLGIPVAGENGGYAGRSHTFYTYNGCQLVGVAATAEGIPLVSVNNAINGSGKPVARSSSGLGNGVRFTVPLNNAAADLANQQTAAARADGSATHFQFDKWGNPTTTTVAGTNGSAATTVTSNSAEGLLLFVQYPEGNSKTMTYDAGNPVFRSRADLLSIKFDPDPRGGASYTETFQYDPRYDLKSGDQKDGNGFTTTYQLSPDGRVATSIVHGSAGTETFSYNGNGQLVASEDVRGISTTAVYDPTTGFLRSRNLGDNTYTFAYGSDVASQLGRPATVTPPAGAPTQITYNGSLQPVTIKQSALEEDLGYDEQGRVTFRQEQLGDGKALVAHSLYDAKGFLMTNIVDGVEVNGQPTPLEYDFTPDSLSRIKSVRHPQGTLQTFDYDARGNLIKMTLGDYVEEYTRDLNNNLTAVRQGGDLVHATVYDGFDRPVTIARKTGNQDETETDTYYPEGEVNSRTVQDGQFGVAQAQTYDQIDELGRPLHLTITGTTISPTYQYTYAAGAETTVGARMTTKQSWNTAGYDTGLTDPLGTRTIHPDGNGRVTQIDRQEDGATYNDFFSYDDLGNRTSVGDNLGTLFSYSARADGALLAASNALGHVTSYEQSVLSEMLRIHRQDGMEMDFQHDPARKPSYNGDPSAGVRSAYDQDFRLTTNTLRNGAAKLYGNFDPRNMPQTITLPGGGSVTMHYDLQRRMTDKTVSYQGTSYQIHLTMDALDQVRVTTYQQDGGALNTATYNYDQAGPLLNSRFQEDAGDFTVQYGYYDDGTRKSVSYPSGVAVTEQRDTSGRLTGVSDANGNIVKALSWEGNKQPKVVDLGAALHVVNTYDARGRLTGSRVTRLSDGAVVVHLRYQYDGANNLQVRQFLHRNGKADNFVYDTGERLNEAKVATVPLTPAGFTPPLYDRTYNYHQGGLDYLTSTVTTNLAADIPVFATNWTSHDDFLLPTIVDTFNRGQADPLGNVGQTLLQARPDAASGTIPLSATLTHNGNGSLVRIARADGLLEENFYQPNGLRYERRISQSGLVLDFRHFVYDDTGRLLEEYEQTNGAPNLVARYYYATGDAPDAADLADPLTGRLQRYFFLKDNLESVVAVADTNGVVVERAWYDPFGQPVIEPRDTQPPKLQSVIGGDANSLLLVFSEPVSAPVKDPGPGGDIIRFPAQPTNGIVTVSVLSSNIPGTLELPPLVPGYPPYSVLKFTPGQPLPTTSPVGFVGWWPADGNANDVRRAHDGALRGGATFGAGLIGQAFALNGTSAFVEVPDDPALNFGAKDFTAALWVNFNNTAGEQVLIEKWIDSTKSGWSLIKLTNNVLRLALSDGAGGELDVDSGVLALPTTNWVHYAVRRKGNQFTLFTNAVPVASGSATANVSAATTLKFGSREGTRSFLNGRIDEVTLFSRALSDAELTAVAGGVQQPGPVTLTVNSGTLVDDWGNTNDTETLAFQVFSQTGLVYYAAEPVPQTAATPLARSSVGSPFLFHGQYFDYDTGLIYLRARFYDSYSGMFFEPDPLGYADSVNLYAGMGNNPASYRDPSGLVDEFDIERAGLRAGEELNPAAREAGTEIRAGEDLVRGTRPGVTEVPVNRVVNRSAEEEALRAEQIQRYEANMARNREELRAIKAQRATEANLRTYARLQQDAARRAAQQAARNAHFRPFLRAAEDRVVSLMVRNGGMDEAAARTAMRQRIILAGAGEDQLILNAARTAPQQGYFDVFIHGRPRSIYYNGADYTAEYLADLIKAHPGYREGMKIRLVSCRTGQEADGFAKQLSRRLSVDIQAPNGVARSSGRGGISIDPDVYGNAGTVRTFTWYGLTPE